MCSSRVAWRLMMTGTAVCGRSTSRDRCRSKCRKPQPTLARKCLDEFIPSEAREIASERSEEPREGLAIALRETEDFHEVPCFGPSSLRSSGQAALSPSPAARDKLIQA